MSTKLTNERIRRDNPHFGKIEIIEEGEYKPNKYFTKYKIVRATGISIPGRQGKYNARAVYLWSPSKKEWVLGAN